MRVAVEYNTFDDVYKNSWSGALDTLNDIQRAEKEADFMWLLEEMFEDRTPTETEVNDFIWFDREYIYEQCGLDENGNLIDENAESREMVEESLVNLKSAEEFDDFCDDCETCCFNCSVFPSLQDCERGFDRFVRHELTENDIRGFWDFD